MSTIQFVRWGPRAAASPAAGPADHDRIGSATRASPNVSQSVFVPRYPANRPPASAATLSTGTAHPWPSITYANSVLRPSAGAPQSLKGMGVAERSSFLFGGGGPRHPVASSGTSEAPTTALYGPRYVVTKPASPATGKRPLAEEEVRRQQRPSSSSSTSCSSSSSKRRRSTEPAADYGPRYAETSSPRHGSHRFDPRVGTPRTSAPPRPADATGSTGRSKPQPGNNQDKLAIYSERRRLYPPNFFPVPRPPPEFYEFYGIPTNLVPG